MRARVALLALLFGCGPAEAPEAPSTSAPAEPAPAEAAPEAPSEPGTPADPAPAEGTTEAAAPAEGTCERARACCRAYVAAIPSARRPLEERGCQEMDEVLVEAGSAAEEACEAAIGGWRQSLQLTGLEVPAACAAP